jgi:hypothetical protein
MVRAFLRGMCSLTLIRHMPDAATHLDVEVIQDCVVDRDEEKDGVSACACPVAEDSQGGTEDGTGLFNMPCASLFVPTNPKPVVQSRQQTFVQSPMHLRHLKHLRKGLLAVVQLTHDRECGRMSGPAVGSHRSLRAHSASPCLVHRGGTAAEPLRASYSLAVRFPMHTCLVMGLINIEWRVSQTAPSENVT